MHRPGSPERRADLRPSLRVIAIADLERLGAETLGAVESALRGGATMIQLRAKRAAPRVLFDTARALGELCRVAGVPFLVNDRPDVARAAGADGAHVGPDDLPPEAARTVLGNRLLGVSARDPARAEAAARAAADYLGTGALRASGTKHDTAVIGVTGIAAIIRRTAIPVVAIGGVRPEDAAALRRAGAAGVAVVGGIFGADDPERAARAYREAWDSAPASPASS